MEYPRLGDGDRRSPDGGTGFRDRLCGRVAGREYRLRVFGDRRRRRFISRRDREAGGAQGLNRLVDGSLLQEACGDQGSNGVGSRRGADRLRLCDRLGCLGFCCHGHEHRVCFGGLRFGDHASSLLHRCDLGPDEQAGCRREEALAQHLATGLGDHVEERLRPAVLDEQEGERPAR